MEAAPEVFAALADPTRWRVLTLLAERDDGTLGDLAAAWDARLAAIKRMAEEG